MSDTFEKREKGEEEKFRFDQELRFKAEARRNKLLGLWAAEKMGLGAAATEAYAKQVVEADLAHPGVDDVVQKVMKDFKAHHVTVTEREVRHEIGRLDAVAREQVLKEAAK